MKKSAEKCRFLLNKGGESVNDKCILCKNCGNSQEHVINDCTKTEK